MKKFALLSLLFLTLFACRKDVDESLTSEVTMGEPTTTTIPYNPEVEEVTATLFGIVTDENGVLIANAAVKLDNTSISTDEAGRFVFKDITMNALGTFVQIKKGGYFDASHRFFPEEGSVNYVTIAMLAKDNSGTFISNDGGVITTPDGVEIDFPANSIINANGTTYDGSVEVFAKWIDPTADNLQEIMPGNLQGIRIEDGAYQEVALASYGMVAVELESPNGAPLNLGNDLNATISFPVPDALLADAPAEIPLWSFNDTYGIWVQEGTATLTGNKYVGEVSHFSFWNCDYPYPLIELSGTVVTSDGTPVQNTTVKLTLDNGATGWGYTNGAGTFSGKVPKDEAFLIEIYQWSGCGEIYSDNIGPFSVDTDLGDIVVELDDLLEVSGTILNCDDNPVTNGWVNLTLDGTTYSYYINDGNFSTALHNCNDATELTVVAGDLDNLVTSDVLTYTVTNPLDLGVVKPCDNPLLEYFIVTIDNETTTFPNPFLILGGPDSTFFGSGFLPSSDFSFSVSMLDLTGTGVYNNDDVTNSDFFLPGSGASYYFMNCSNSGGQNLCGYTEINITQYAPNVGDTLLGTLEGVAEATDQNQNMVTLPFSAEFKIIRD